MNKTIAQYESEIATLKKVNARLNNEVHDAQQKIIALETGEELAETKEALEEAEEKAESLQAQLDEGAYDADIAQATREWFERKDLNFATMDAETAQLLRVVGHERYYV